MSNGKSSGSLLLLYHTNAIWTLNSSKNNLKVSFVICEHPSKLRLFNKETRLSPFVRAPKFSNLLVKPWKNLISLGIFVTIKVNLGGAYELVLCVLPNCWTSISADFGGSIIMWCLGLLLIFFWECREIPDEPDLVIIAIFFVPFWNLEISLLMDGIFSQLRVMQQRRRFRPEISATLSEPNSSIIKSMGFLLNSRTLPLESNTSILFVCCSYLLNRSCKHES